jgi:two-component system sensor histidine kinase YesM
MIEITVADNGIGMTEATLNHLYESLSSMSSYHQESFGLRNVNDTIKLFFGKQYGLEITSHYQVGTTVRITLPFIQMKDEAEHVSGFTG